MFVLLYFFLLFIVLSVLLQYTDSDYPFGICKLFLEVLYICNTRSNLNGLILFTKMYFYITDCTPDPCVHGTCTNSIHGFTCSCNTGYTGHICDQGIDWFIVLSTTFSNISAISWRPVLVLQEAGVPGENHRSWASNW